MRKILVIGSGGAGKSTFSKRLSEITKIELIHLDRFYWKPNWIETDKREWMKMLEELLAKDAWIMDGNYDGTLEMRLEKADTLIFLDLPRTVCLYRVAKRALKHRGTNRPDMAEGCNEKFDWEFAKWIWDFPKTDKLKIEKTLEKFDGKKEIIRLRSAKEVEKFLFNFGKMK